MIQRPFPENPGLRRLLLIAAILWTIGIFVACLWPGKELPHSDIPFVDKWTHFILFGVFSYLWLCALSSVSSARLVWMTLIAAALGWFVECLQGWLPQLGRTKDVMDAVADAIGGFLGSIIYRISIAIANKKSNI